MAVVLAALLAAQMGLNYRDGLAAEWPASQPWLRRPARPWAAASRHRAASTASAWTAAASVRVEGSPQYRLSLVVHNRSSVAVRMPAIELTLTDTQGQTMARRVLT